MSYTATAANTPQCYFLLAPQMLATSITLPIEMLRSAAAMQQAAKRGNQTLSINLLAQSQETPSLSGLTLKAAPLPKTLPRGSTVFIPALWRNPQKVLGKMQPTINWLAHVAANHRLAAVGTGVCLLAEAGLLDGKVATTHWHYFEPFQQRYPNVKLARDRFITRSDNIYCTASINATAELTAFFIQDLFGVKIAQTVERHFFHEIRAPKTRARLQTTPAGSNELVAMAIGLLDEVVSRLIHTQGQAQINIQALADELSVSVRSLNRHFREALSTTPMEYIQQKRLEHAEDLLKTSNLSIADIANLSGFLDPQHFSRRFRKSFGVSPRQYRITVRAKLFEQMGD